MYHPDFIGVTGEKVGPVRCAASVGTSQPHIESNTVEQKSNLCIYYSNNSKVFHSSPEISRFVITHLQCSYPTPAHVRYLVITH